MGLIEKKLRLLIFVRHISTVHPFTDTFNKKNAEVVPNQVQACSVPVCVNTPFAV